MIKYTYVLMLSVFEQRDVKCDVYV